MRHLSYHFDLYILIGLFCILCLLLEYAFADMGYYTRVPTLKTWIIRCHSNYAVWFRLDSAGELHFKRYVWPGYFHKRCTARGWQRRWLVFKTNLLGSY